MAKIMLCNKQHETSLSRNIMGLRNSADLYWASQVVLMVKNLPANAGDVRDMGLTLRLGRSPGGGNGTLLQDFCQENPIYREAWQPTVHGVAKS